MGFKLDVGKDTFFFFYFITKVLVRDLFRKRILHQKSFFSTTIYYKNKQSMCNIKSLKREKYFCCVFTFFVLLVVSSERFLYVLDMLSVVV